jgi:hypothetical protein
MRTKIVISDEEAGAIFILPAPPASRRKEAP